VEANKVPSVLV